MDLHIICEYSAWVTFFHPYLCVCVLSFFYYSIQGISYLDRRSSSGLWVFLCFLPRFSLVELELAMVTALFGLCCFFKPTIISSCPLSVYIAATFTALDQLFCQNRTEQTLRCCLSICLSICMLRIVIYLGIYYTTYVRLH